MFNLVVLKGRLTSDPELKTTPNGISVTSFSIANDKGFGEDKKTSFVPIVAWRGTAEFITKYFTKGSLIEIIGSIQTRKYQDSNGNNRTVFEVVANEVDFGTPKSASNGFSAVDSNSPEEEAKGFSNVNTGDFTAIDDDSDLPF